jgi:hypothetical protein
LRERSPVCVSESPPAGTPGLAPLAKTIIAQAASADAENAQSLGQDAREKKLEQRGDKLALGEIARGAENDEQTREFLVGHGRKHSARSKQ